MHRKAVMTVLRLYVFVKAAYNSLAREEVTVRMKQNILVEAEIIEEQ